MNFQKGSVLLRILLGLFVMVAISGGLYVYQKNQHKNNPIDILLVPVATSTPKVVVGGDTPTALQGTSVFMWGRTSMEYPSDWKITNVHTGESVFLGLDGKPGEFYSGTLKTADGKLIAQLRRNEATLPEPNPEYQVAATDVLSNRRLITAGGVTVNKSIMTSFCDAPNCFNKQIIYFFHAPGDSAGIDYMIVEVNSSSHDTFFTSIAQAEAVIDTIVKTLKASYDPSRAKGICTTFSYDLAAGMTDVATNGEVSLLQLFLIEAKAYSNRYTTPNDYQADATVSGIFDSVTSQALQVWQARHNIEITTPGVGKFGPKTRAVMAQGCSEGVEPGW